MSEANIWLVTLANLDVRIEKEVNRTRTESSVEGNNR